MVRAELEGILPLGVGSRRTPGAAGSAREPVHTVPGSGQTGTHGDDVRPSTPCRRRTRRAGRRRGGDGPQRRGTILGADDKAAVAVMIEAARRIVDERIYRSGVELLFTPMEEVGLAAQPPSTSRGSRRGSDTSTTRRRRSATSPKRRKARTLRRGFMVAPRIADGPGPAVCDPGGRTGRSQTSVCGSSSTTSRPRTSAGSREGRHGTSSRVVCSRPRRAGTTSNARQSRTGDAGGVPARRLRLRLLGRDAGQRPVLGVSLPSARARAPHRVRGATQRGVRAPRILSGGAAFANVFNEAGLPCVNLGTAWDIHTPDEHIAIDDLEAMVEVKLSHVEAAPVAP